MNVHFFSLSSWSEPHRIRQQLAHLVSSKYDVQYHSPFIYKTQGIRDSSNGILFHNFFFIKKYSSLPIISFLNAISLFFYFKIAVKKGDVIINFLPEVSLMPKMKSAKFISVINDDFSSMAPKISSWWIKWMMEKMAINSDATLYVSTQLMGKYKSNRQFLFYPWSDKTSIINSKSVKSKSVKNVILYWGYLTTAIDYDLIERFAHQITESALDLNIKLIGPIDPSVLDRVTRIVASHECVTYQTPRELSQVDMDQVLFGIELISSNFNNSINLEFPNKGPRLLSYGVPLVYSGCNLLDEKFFIRYQGNLASIAKHIQEHSSSIQYSIEEYFLNNNSKKRLDIIDKIIQE